MFEKYNDKEASRKIIKKRNDLLIYKKMLEERNKIYTMVGNKVDELSDLINNFYNLNWKAIVDLNKLKAHDRETLRRNSFIKERNKKKIPPYIIASWQFSLTQEEKKQAF